MKGDLQVRRFRQVCEHLLPEHGRVVVAVSGGADSLALMHLLLAARWLPSHALLVAHFDHGLRANSGDDAHFVASEAAKVGLACVVELWQPVSVVRRNVAEQARLARYDFLLRCAKRFNATQIVTGHHQDDQAETFLERLLRGSGVRGLGAMRALRVLEEGAASTVVLIRPMLFLSRAEVRDWLARRGLGWREDPSNRTPSARRSRIRHQALPDLQEVADGELLPRLASTAERMAQADAALEWMLLRLWPEWKPQIRGSGELSLSVQPLLTLPDEMLCRCLHHCHQRLTGSWQPPNARAVAGFVYLLRTRRRHWSMRMRGLAVQRRQECLLFQSVGAVSAKISG